MTRPTIAFDLDGTLSDWEAAIRLAEPEHAERLLEVLDGRTPARTVSWSTAPTTCCSSWRRDLGRRPRGRRRGRAASERFMAAFRAVAFAEVDAVLDELADRYRLALVTNSPRATPRWRTWA